MQLYIGYIITPSQLYIFRARFSLIIKALDCIYSIW
jgi:hypothetical protein